MYYEIVGGRGNKKGLIIREMLFTQVNKNILYGGI